MNPSLPPNWLWAIACGIGGAGLGLIGDWVAMWVSRPEKTMKDVAEELREIKAEVRNLQSPAARHKE